MSKKEKAEKKELEDLKKRKKKLKALLHKESKLTRHRTLKILKELEDFGDQEIFIRRFKGKPLSYNEKEMLKKSRKDIRLGRVSLFKLFLRDRKRLRVALRERCTGPYIVYLGSGLSKVEVLPLERQLANWNSKVLKEPNLIEELD